MRATLQYLYEQKYSTMGALLPNGFNVKQKDEILLSSLSELRNRDKEKNQGNLLGHKPK